MPLLIVISVVMVMVMMMMMVVMMMVMMMMMVMVMVMVTVIGIVGVIRVPTMMMMMVIIAAVAVILRQLYIRQLLWLPVIPRRSGFRRIDGPEKSNCIGYGLKQVFKRARTHHLSHVGSPCRGWSRAV